MKTLTGFIDCHSHSDCSPDAKNTMHEMYQKACELGLSVYGISDHCEIDLYREDGYCERIERAKEEMQKEKLRRQPGTLLLYGIEIGQPMKNLDLARDIVQKNNYDFVLYSLHRAGSTPDFSLMDFQRDYASYEKQQDLLNEYYEELLQMARTESYDLLAHPTYPLRHLKCLGVNLDGQQELLDEIFREVIRRGKGIEINSSGYNAHHHTNELMPEYPLIQRYRQLGGEILSFGSDAHTTADLGAGLKQAKEAALSAGFRYVAYFVQRKVNFLKL